MGEVRQALPVMPVCALFSRHAELLEWAEAQLQRIWGPVALRSRDFPFDNAYYQRSMGAQLVKRFWAASEPADPARLSDWKLATQQMEHEAAAQVARDEPRPLNLDPGYVTEAKLVLATTKDRDHRVYLQQGIYAEVTLSYHHGCWQPSPWTYPDYRQPEYHEFLDQCRGELRRRMGKVAPRKKTGDVER